MPTLIFVCTANVCRSPMAEALFISWLKRNEIPGEWRVGSMGTWAAKGQPATDYARQVMAERGLDLARHRSRIVSEKLLAQADLVLCMTRSHRKALQAEFPKYATRIKLFSEIVGQIFDVDDPIGGPRAGYVETAKEMEELIEQGGGKIVELVKQTGSGYA